MSSTADFQFIAAGIVGAVFLSYLSYRAMRFEYEIQDERIKIVLRWLGSSRFKEVDLRSVSSAAPLASRWQLVPFVRFPRIWGRFQPSQMVVLNLRCSISPIIVSPADPGEFLQRLAELGVKMP